ncbi:MAG: DUF2306 domain-containing protein [Pseudomonadota bacterium]
MTDLTSSTFKLPVRADQLLAWSGRSWFAIAAIGQIAFIVFILSFYGPSTFSGNFAAWNDKPLIDGHIEGDAGGNAMFAGHVMLAAVMALAGLMQLTPQIRRRAPAFHRATGRVFLVTACTLALGGFWLVFVRGTQLSMISAIATSVDAALILICAGMTVRYAMQRKIAVHEVWAMRLFMVAHGVWFMRIMMMAWIILAGGPVGMNRTLSGPTDMVIAFGCYLIPPAIYELYRRARASRSASVKTATAGLVFVSAGVTAIGVFGTVAFMWLPYM